MGENSMEFLTKQLSALEQIPQKKFYTYLGIFLASILTVSALIGYRYYSYMQFLHERIEQINELRDQVQDLLTQSEQVKKQFDAVRKMLDEDEDFKITGYLKDLLNTFKIPEKNRVVVIPSTTERDEKYTETELKIQLTELNMKQLTELLQEISNNTRVYTKELEITKSRKNTRAIDIHITIATVSKKSPS